MTISFIESKLFRFGSVQRASKRGLPGKCSQDAQDQPRSYWLGEVFLDQGWAWTLDLVDVQPEENEVRRRRVIPICLGMEEEVKPVLKGYSPIPDKMGPRHRTILARLLEAHDNGAVESTAGAYGIQRGSNARTTGNRQRHPRRLKARKGLSLRQTHYKG